MARSIAVRVGRVWQTLLGGPDDAAGATDSVTVDFVPGGSGAVFGGVFGGTF